MPRTRAQIEAEALNLPVEDRARLAEALIHSLDADSDIEAAWDAEIGRRLQEVEAGEASLVGAEEAISQLRRRLGQ